ncbi:hypothetical protein EB118_20865 [bacterium]|nr:hypothetical protein [bacterium]NDD84718.1 hypothetical protein [bacterium]NDG32512.1 hypothetical protein [bacterium]
MQFNEFYDRLYNIAMSYHWDIDNNNRLVATIKSGPARGFTLNPITALAHKSGFGYFRNTREDTEFAASLLGISRKLARNIYSATLATYNRGNTQVVRGRIRNALEV